MTGVLVLCVALVVTAALALVHRWYDGRLRPRQTQQDLRPMLPEAPGERATLVQFSTAFCAPCRATKRVLHEVAQVVPGVTHVEVDAESRLDLVRALDILKTPTTLVLDSEGREVLRATGRPSKQAVLSALVEAVPS
jgi:thiol-disulfide isomerase/thioredoxin